MRSIFTLAVSLLFIANISIAQNIGINTTTPGDKLEVNGNIRFTGDGTLYIAPSNSGSGKSLWLRAGAAHIPSGGAGGNVNIEATNNMPAGGAGYGNLGAPGVVNITAGSGYNSAGGNVNITAGQSSYWGLANDSHSDVILKGGYNLNATDPATITTEGGHIFSGNPSSSTGGSIILKPGAGIGGGINGMIKLDGATMIGYNLNLTGGASGSPQSLQYQNSFVTLNPANGTNNYFQFPSAAAYTGRMYIIRNNSASFTAILNASSGQIVTGSSGATLPSFTLNSNSSPKTVMAISDGTNWIVVSLD